MNSGERYHGVGGSKGMLPELNTTCSCATNGLVVPSVAVISALRQASCSMSGMNICSCHDASRSSSRPNARSMPKSNQL